MSIESKEDKSENFLGRKRAEPDDLKKEIPECIIHTGDKAFKIKCTVIRNNTNNTNNSNLLTHNIASSDNNDKDKNNKENNDKDSNEIKDIKETNNETKEVKEIKETKEEIKNNAEATKNLSPVKKQDNPFTNTTSQINQTNRNSFLDYSIPSTSNPFFSSSNINTSSNTNNNTSLNHFTNSFAKFANKNESEKSDEKDKNNLVTSNPFASFIPKNKSDNIEDKDNLFSFNKNEKNDKKDKVDNGKNEDEENSDDSDDEKENYEPDATILFKENEKEVSPYIKIFSKQINKLFEYSKEHKKFLSKGKGILSIEHTKIGEKNIVAIVYRNPMGSNLLNGLMSKDLTKFKSDYENSRHVASFNIIKTNESTHKHELSLCKIPFINDAEILDLEKAINEGINLLKN